MTGKLFTLEVQPKIPSQLARIEELANDLLYSWDRNVRALFFRLDAELWETCGHCPKVFLRRVSQERLEQATRDQVFMEDFNRVISVYDTYKNAPRNPLTDLLNPETDLIAYFCAEFGFHESLPIYSGGLGILAGDHCKAASDLAIPFVAVGLMYRQGYFTQSIDNLGNQVAHYATTDFDNLPISPAMNSNGEEVHVNVQSNGNTINIKVWEARAGRIKLFLLDTDVEQNNAETREITHRLYGGDRSMRIQQEIVLGIGGVRALHALGLNPTVWHINEGHSAFQVIERCYQYSLEGLDFDSAIELVAAGTVFTTHTPVPAGHDIFEHALIDKYLDNYENQLGISRDRFLALGASPGNDGSFNMTALAMRGSRFQNGVSRIHGEVASQMEGYIWPQVPAYENPISYVTNGVHVPTFLAREWTNLFDMRFKEWRNELNDPEYWDCIDEIPDYRFWSLRQSLKGEMMENILQRIVQQMKRNGCSEAQIKRLVRFIEPRETDILTLGFARRFATYKRATLLFSDPQRLARIVNNSEKPVLLIFAGKAHPHDQPGQHLIRVIHDFSRRPEFEGRIVLLEGYDMSLARKLVAGVDVWVNTPEHPMEASGTSGEKAGINGVINLSVLDGWWGEGFTSDNGWAIAPHGQEFDSEYRNQEESKDLLDILENEVVPNYYERDGKGYSEIWTRMSKASMRTIIPNFNAQRMVKDYINQFYSRANNHQKILSANNYEPARELAAWKKKIAETWPEVKIRRVEETPSSVTIKSGETLPVRIAAELNGLTADDVIVECIVGTLNRRNDFKPYEHFIFEPLGTNDKNETLFHIDLKPTLPGKQLFKLRMYPSHRLLANRFESGFMIWVK